MSLPGLFDRAVDVGLRLAPFEGAAIPKAPGYAGGWLHFMAGRQVVGCVGCVGASGTGEIGAAPHRGPTGSTPLRQYCCHCSQQRLYSRLI